LEVLDILRELVSVPGISATSSEKAAGDRIYEILSGFGYFKAHNGYLGRYACPGDALRREVIYGIVKGSSDKTVILMGHYDVVGIEDYGKIKDYAFDIYALPEKLKEIGIDENVARDLKSGEWIFGRGAADMKAGLAIDLWLTDSLSKTQQKGNIVFLAVPDEESFSVGMRAAVRLLKDLKEKYAFDYELCVDSEPGRQAEGKHIVSLGTVGKCMPVVMVQGEKAHISMCFDGLNPLGIFSEIFRATELNLDFSDEFNGSKTMPPSWIYFKDMKYEYDVSLPIRAAGYFSVMSYYSAPDEIMGKLKKICEDCFSGYVSHMKDVFDRFNKGQTFNTAKGINYQTAVMTMAELLDYCRGRNGFAAFRETLYADIKIRLGTNELNLPQATMEMMARTLDFSGITKPLVLLGFAPPYYSPLRSDNIIGKENRVSGYLKYINSESQRLFGVEVCGEDYMGAMTDLSYLALDSDFDIDNFAKNMPLWGDIYSIDFEAVKAVNIPGILFGPWGKDYHQSSERVYRHDVETRIPVLKKSLIESIFDQ